MKKRRVILAILLSFVLLFTVAISAACVDNDDPNQGNQGNQGGDTPQPEVGSWALQKIVISGSYKKEYQLNEQFSADGLKVSATMMNTETRATRTDDVTSQATVNSSRYNSAMVGNYVITISYTNTGVTRYADYTVKVLPYEPAINGISMTKTTVDYDIPSGHLTVSVNLDDITVKAINANGEEEETPLAADAYTLSFYKGGQKLDSLENAMRGSYTIQAERKSDGQKAFVVVNVTGGIAGITASTTQETIELANEEATAVINAQDITVKTDGGDVVVANATSGPCIAINCKLYSVVDGTETELNDWTVGVGKYKVKITATYALAANKTVDFTTEVTITVRVKDVGEPTAESFILPVLGNAEAFTATSYGAGSSISDNTLFELKATVGMTTSYGKEFGFIQHTNGDGSNAVSYTTMGGTTVKPDQGIKLSSAIKTQVTVESILTVTAKSDITLYLYVVWANDSFNSNKSGDVFYSINGGEKITQSLSARKTVWTISVELKEGQVLTLGAKNTHSDDGKLWLFGAEAVTK